MNPESMKALKPLAVVVICAAGFFGCKKSTQPNSKNDNGPKTYIITAYANGPGTISPNADTVYAGGRASFTFIPHTNYGVSALSVDGQSITPNTTYSFDNVQADHKISVAFAPLETISLSTNGNGTASISPTTIIMGQSATITLVPNQGYVTDSLRIDGVLTKLLSGQTTYTLSNITQNHSIFISFALTAKGLDSLKNLLVGSWTMTSYQSRFEPLAHVDFFPWGPQPVYPCAATQYDSFLANGTFQRNNDPTACDPIAQAQDKPLSTSQWMLKNNGKVIYLNGSRLDSLRNVVVTKDSLSAVYLTGDVSSGILDAYWYHYVRRP